MVGNSLVLVAQNDAKFASERSENAVDSKCSFIIPFCVATMCINSAFLKHLSIILHAKIVEEVLARSTSETFKPKISPIS